MKIHACHGAGLLALLLSGCDTGPSEELECPTPQMFYGDADGDGYGDAAASMEGCSPPEGFVADATDCNDSDAAVHPGAIELCTADDIDDNCNGLIDGDDSTVSSESWTIYHLDADGDGHGGDAVQMLACEDPSTDGAHYTADTTDCDDANAAVYPGSVEVCDDANVDEDCDGLSDDDDPDVVYEDALALYLDGDLDGFGGEMTTAEPFCDLPGPGWSPNDRDCDDSDPAISPGERETVDSEDNDCDGLVDEQGVSDGEVKWIGSDKNQEIGETVVFLGDINADGLDDYGFHSVEGGAFVVYGDDARTWDTSTDELALRVPETGLQGIGAAGDLDGDGIDDFFLHSGASVDLFWGSASGHSIGASTDREAYLGSPFGSSAFNSAAGVGDLDGDGYDDLLFGVYEAPMGDLTVSRVYWIEGDERSAFPGEVFSESTPSLYSSTSWMCTSSLAAAGDTNGDGIDDALIGCPGGSYDRGFVFWLEGSFSGPATGDLDDITTRLNGELTGDEAGASVSGAGDVNQDGYDDVLVGTGEANRAYLVLGSSTGITNDNLRNAESVIYGETASDELGRSVSLAGDANGDGFADVLIGAENSRSHVGKRAGASYLFLGGADVAGSWTSETADWKIGGEVYLDDAGASVAGGGDVNGDGFDELLIGAPLNDTNGRKSGAVYLIHGRSGL